MKILNVVLTGGPCSGKTTAIEEIKSNFTEKGYNVYTVPEAATILINSGIRPFGDYAMSLEQFQNYVIELQIKLEHLAHTAAKLSNQDSIILYDRGIIDDKAYVSNEVFKKLLIDKDKTESDIMNNYDLVIHLKTAAARDNLYTLENNKARTETKDEALEKDKKTLQAWIGHDNLKIIGIKDSFQEKIDCILQEIYNSLEKPYPIQKQHKYLVNNIDLEKLNNKASTKLEIEQYIIKDDIKDIIYRKTTKDKEYSYKKIIKKDTESPNNRAILKRPITEEEYYENFDNSKVINKTRYCFAYKEQYFRIDIFDTGLKILEIEETNKTKDIKIPDFINIEKEVTNDKNYRNSNLINNKVYIKVI